MHRELQDIIEDIEEDTKKWRDIPCPWTGRVTIVKMVILPKAIFNTIPIQILKAFCKEVEPKKIIRFLWNHKRPQIAKAILRKKNKAGDSILPNLKLYYKAIITK